MKNQIIEMLNKADERKIRLVYFIKSDIKTVI